MLKWAIVCFILSLVAGMLGFTQVSADLAGIGKVLFFIFLFFFLLFLVGGLLLGRKVAGKLGIVLAALFLGGWRMALQAIDPAPVPDSQSIAAGRYMITIAPGINKDMASRLQKAVSNVNGVEDVETKTLDGTIHFKVKEGAEVRPSEIQKAVVKVDPKAVMTTPILENSLTANPGL